MSVQLTQVDVNVRDRRLDRATADELRGWLPREDAMVAQQVLCETLAMPVPVGETDADRLATLLVIDGMARRTCGRLLDRYVEAEGEERSLDRRVFVSMSQLGQSMAVAYDRLLQRAGDIRSPDRVELTASVIVRLLAYRQIEYLLRMFRYKRRNANPWRAVHATYRFALERGLHKHPVSTGGSGAASGATTTVEEQYIPILLMEGMNSGQLSPREALWACRWAARWSRVLSLRPDVAAVPSPPPGFAIDLNGAEGPTRKPLPADDGVLYLDTAPLAEMFDKARSSLLETTAAVDGRNESRRHAQLALLDKIKVMLAPLPVQLERRGQRTSVVATLQVVAGLPHIIHTLRKSTSRSGSAETVAASLGDATIGAYGGPTRTQTLGAWNAAGFAPGTVPEVWQVRDHSDSGCRMRGKTADLNRVVPGSLLAIRANENAAWTLAIVRRLRRLMVDHVEVGIEYVGRRPRYVKIATEAGRDRANASHQGKCVGALYVPPSDGHPAMPIRTLVLATRDFRPDREKTLLSSNGTYTLRMSEPIRCEADFVWTSFNVVQRTGPDAPALRKPGR